MPFQCGQPRMARVEHNPLLSALLHHRIVIGAGLPTHQFFVIFPVPLLLPGDRNRKEPYAKNGHEYTAQRVYCTIPGIRK